MFNPVMDNEVMINIGIILTVVAVYIIAKNWKRHDKEYARLYHEIVNSDKYRVKGKQD
jgi:hypothetical protein